MLILNAGGLQIRPSGNKEERRKRMKNLFNSEQFLLAFTGIVSVWYACS